ncbi:unnamed protein product [Amaranthus hypochondriacus]
MSSHGKASTSQLTLRFANQFLTIEAKQTILIFAILSLLQVCNAFLLKCAHKSQPTSLHWQAPSNFNEGECAAKRLSDKRRRGAIKAHFDLLQNRSANNGGMDRRTHRCTVTCWNLEVIFGFDVALQCV